MYFLMRGLNSASRNRFSSLMWNKVNRNHPLYALLLEFHFLNWSATVCFQSRTHRTENPPRMSPELRSMSKFPLFRKRYHNSPPESVEVQ